MQKYETATNRVAPSRLHLFAPGLAVPVTWFVGGLPPATTGRTEVPFPEHKLQSRETAPLVEAHYRRDPERHRAVYHLMRSITGTPD